MKRFLLVFSICLPLVAMDNPDSNPNLKKHCCLTRLQDSLTAADNSAVAILQNIPTPATAVVIPAGPSSYFQQCITPPTCSSLSSSSSSSSYFSSSGAYCSGSSDIPELKMFLIYNNDRVFFDVRGYLDNRKICNKYKLRVLLNVSDIMNSKTTQNKNQLILNDLADFIEEKMLFQDFGIETIAEKIFWQDFHMERCEPCKK